jgi:predicted chitinase
MLATAWHETAKTYQPITEYGNRAYFNKYNGRFGNDKQDDGYRYRGRGYVQLTFKDNYRYASKQLSALKQRYPDGVDLVKEPDLALDPKIASDILVMGMREGWFTRKKLSDYINEKTCDYYRARKIINRLDRASKIANAAKKFETLLMLSMPKAEKIQDFADQQLW